MRTPLPPQAGAAPRLLDLRERPQDADRDDLMADLRGAYEERWRLFAAAAGEDELLQNAVELAELELRCRPAPRALPRRTGPDPATFLG